MSECACDCVLLGRQGVQGTANADSLATLISQLSRRPVSHRKCRLRCSRDGLELRAATRPRKHEDEGFESDDDAVSHTSSDSNASSCCLVEDHVLRIGMPATDSANGSGASDNDDAENSLTVVVPSTPLPPQTPKKSVDDVSKEFYEFNDVAFCHTDAAFPKVLVLVIKKKTKKEEKNPTTGLEAVVFQCKSVENLREVCASYKEFSRRLKMDLQFRYPHRRKDPVVDTPSCSLYRNVFDDLQKSMSSPSAAPDSPFFKTWITQVSGKPQLDFQTVESNKYNLVQRTDDDGVTHIEVSKAVDGDVGGSVPADEYSGSSSIISISTPDVGNLVVSPTTASQQDPFPSLSDLSADSSEIEGVICADVDSSLTGDSDSPKYTVSSGKTEAGINRTEGSKESSTGDTPPQRPQRGKYIKKNTSKQNESKASTKSKPTNGKDRPAPKAPPDASKHQSGTQERVVRGQFIRVNVEQKTAVNMGGGSGRAGRLFGGEPVSYPVWNLPAQELTMRAPRARTVNRLGENASVTERKSYQRRSRSTGRTASPPRVFRLMDPPVAVAPTKPLTNRFLGKLREIASMNNTCVSTLSRRPRRNSSGDLIPTAQFYHYLEPTVTPSQSHQHPSTATSLKSVIKKKNCNENLEPKKVTFSAFATVQVVD